MKNITRRGFLQLTAATALVCAAAPLTGCGKKNKKELIIGTWYRQGSDDLAFTIYDDGTCMIDNDYGKGTWSIANEDQFTLTGFYGNSEIFTIIAIDKKSVTFGPPNADKNTDQTIVFWHTAEDAKKECWVNEEGQKEVKSMRTAQRLAALGVVAAIVLSGCSNGKDSYSSAEKEESGQPLQSASISESSSVESAELAESANAGYPTLKEIAQNYNGCALEYPNMEELSVGMLYGDSGNRYCLFDVDGRVHHVFESDTYIASGFYNGMCMTSTRVMAKEDGTLFRPSYLSNDEIIIRYAKDDDGTLLWTVRREDSIEGTKAIITAWDTNGEIRFQCDTTRDEFSKMNSDTVYKDLANNDYDSIGISQAFAYCGGSVYRIRSDFYYVFMNIDTEKFFSVREPNAYLIQAEGNLMIRTMPGLRALDDDFNELPEWEAIKSRRSETPVLSEGLIYLDVRRDAGDFEDYPSGFYDVHLNQVIDLSQYNIQSIYEDEPRFINGYAVLQMKNPEGVPFWGVIKRDGTWAAEPQKGSVRYVYQTADGVLITTCEENTEQWYTYDQTGTKLDEWDRIKFDGSYGYAQDSSSGHRGICEVYNGYTYASLNSHVAKISSDGSYEYLS